MSRRKREIPAYRFYKPRNCAKAVFGRVTVYFPGPFRSEESRAAYRRIVAEWLATGRLPNQSGEETDNHHQPTAVGLLE